MNNELNFEKYILPQEIIDYLLKKSWKKVDNKRSDIYIYQNTEDNNFYQVKLTTDKTYSDYYIAIYKTIKTIAQKENKTTQEIIENIINNNKKILKIRIKNNKITNGSIPLNYAVNLYTNIKKMLTATIIDMDTPKIYHSGRINENVTQYLQNCRFGQTEVGSYVVTLVCPDSRFAQQSMFDCEQNFGEKVIIKILNDVSYIKSYIDEKKNEENFFDERSDEKAISVNFLEALKALNLEQNNTELELFANLTNKKEYRVKITNKYYNNISKMIKSFHKELDAKITLVGKIVQLDAEGALEERNGGKIKLLYFAENNKAKKIDIRLRKNEYDLAIVAHQKGNNVRIIGERDKEHGNSFICDNFTII